MMPKYFDIEQQILKVKFDPRPVSGGGMEFEIGNGLILEQGVLSVDTADKVEQDNTKPVTSAAVFTEVGNIAELLSHI